MRQDTILENRPDMRLSPASDALFLDFDGTLVDIAATPEGVVVPASLIVNLGRLQQLFGGALALVSGRPIETLDRFLAPLRLAATGIHGAQMRLFPGGAIEQPAAALSPALIEAVQRFAEEEPEARLEWKGLSVAIHYPARSELAGRIGLRLQHLVAGHDGCVLQWGRNVCEILSVQVSKGMAMNRMLALPPFRGRRPIMIGDDLTDLAGFSAAQVHGGLGFKVAGGPFSPDESVFGSPADVRRWIAALADTSADTAGALSQR